MPPHTAATYFDVSKPPPRKKSRHCRAEKSDLYRKPSKHNDCKQQADKFRTLTSKTVPGKHGRGNALFCTCSSDCTAVQAQNDIPDDDCDNGCFQIHAKCSCRARIKTRHTDTKSRLHKRNTPKSFSFAIGNPPCRIVVSIAICQCLYFFFKYFRFFPVSHSFPLLT